MLDGVLFFPVTPFAADGSLDTGVLAEHLRRGLDAGPGGVFAACGTGEFHALAPEEHQEVVRTAVKAADGRVPVFAGGTATVRRLLADFFHPLVRLRDKAPGYAVSLVKAGVRLRGLDAGGVRPPLTDPPPEHVAELRRILDAGLAVAS